MHGFDARFAMLAEEAATRSALVSRCAHLAGACRAGRLKWFLVDCILGIGFGVLLQSLGRELHLQNKSGGRFSDLGCSKVSENLGCSSAWSDDNSAFCGSLVSKKTADSLPDRKKPP